MADEHNGESVIIDGTDEIAKMQDMTDEMIIKSFIIKSSEAGSKQILNDESFKALKGEVVEPLYDPLLWATLMERNTRLRKLIHTYARNTVGLGWGIYPKKPITKDTTEEEKKKIEEEKEKASVLFDYPDEDLPFSEIMYQVKVDEEATGNGYLEISRNINGQIKGLHHIPSHTIRIMSNLNGFVQMRNGNKRYFKKYGIKENMDMYTGKLESELDKDDPRITFIRQANEIIHFKLYSPRDSFYGVPRYVASADAIAGNKMAARRNLAFFKNDATPRLAITVENGTLDQASINEITKFVNTNGKGPENAHRAMVLQAVGKNIPGADQKAVKINVIPLTVGENDDASHIKYRAANDEELREAFGIAEVFLGAKGSVNRATAMVSRAITNEQEFEPDAKGKEYKINNTILREMELKLVQFEFERASSVDELDRADIFAKYLQGGGITPNDIRYELGKDEYTEEWADKPLQLAMIETQMRLNDELGRELGGNNNGGGDGNNDEENDGESGDEDDKGETEGTGESSKELKKSERRAKELTKAIQKMIDEGIAQAIVK